MALTAENTLKLIQSLYEKKLTTYPRVDTTFLPEDMYKNVPEILSKLSSFKDLTTPLLKQKIRKSSKIFDDKKITDHHAIIPTGFQSDNLTSEEKIVFDMITRRFISVFYPDCKVASTTVLGASNQIEFKVTGKQILEKGWRAVYGEDSEKLSEDEIILPQFIKGEHGKHEPQMAEKMTQPPKHFTEATLLRAMETAGKNVDDEELRDLLKENGIGRPSTRANIIETLFKRRYIMRDKKKIIANQIGVDLVAVIENDLLKSAELTGQWEKKIRQIEAGKFDIANFMSDLKQMVTDIVVQVKNSSGKTIAVTEAEQSGPAKAIVKRPAVSKEKDSIVCPKCSKGTILQGKQSWGCSAYKSGCDFRLPFEFLGKKLGNTAVKDLCSNSKTGKLKGFKVKDTVISGTIMLNQNFELKLLEEKPKELVCPRCKEGKILKGNTSWGCSGYRNGCQLRIPFKFMGKTITENQLEQLIFTGKTSKITGFLSENGSKQNGILTFNSSWQMVLVS